MILKEVLHMDGSARRWRMVRISIELSGGTDLTQQQFKPGGVHHFYGFTDTHVNSEMI
jgi:hypothetical protein